MTSTDDSPRVLIPPPLIMLGTLLVGLIVDGRVGLWPDMSPFVFLGALLAASGAGLIAMALGLFRRADTRPEPWQPASNLVLGGIYRFTRNPMYLGMLLIYGGVAVALESPTAGLLLVPLVVVLDRFVVAREEAYLLRRFGAAYLSYQARVRRWV